MANPMATLMTALKAAITDVKCKSFAYDPLAFTINLYPSSDDILPIFAIWYDACCIDRDICPANTPWYLFLLGKWLPVVITLIVIFGTLVVMKRKERMRAQ